MIIDAHVHYTQPETPERPHVFRPAGVDPITFDDLITQARAAGVGRVVQVTASCMGHDNRYAFEGLRARPDAVVGVVGRFDAFAPGLEERLKDYWAQPGMLGIRVTLHHAWTANWLRDGVLLPLFTAAQALDVPLFVYAPDQVDGLRATAQRFPGLRLVVDHTALQCPPGASSDTVFARWDDVITLGREPNVWMKVSFFPEAAAGAEPYPWPTAAQRFAQMYDALGAARMVWGSNFPPVRHACSWRQAVDFMRFGCGFLSERDRSAIVGGNFLRAFGRR